MKLLIILLVACFWSPNLLAFKLKLNTKKIFTRNNPTPTPTPQESSATKYSLEEIEKKWSGKLFSWHSCLSTYTSTQRKGDNLDYELNCHLSAHAKFSPPSSIESILLGTYARSQRFRDFTYRHLDTIILDTGEKFLFDIQEIEKRISDANPHIINHPDNISNIYLNCAHAQQRKINPAHKKHLKIHNTFLEINNCVPRGKFYEIFTKTQEAKKLSDSGKRDDSLRLYSELCYDGDADSCYTGAFEVPTTGEKNWDLKVTLLKKACDLGDQYYCDTHEKWDTSLKSYYNKKKNLKLKCDGNNDNSCIELIKLYSDMWRMNIPEAKILAKRKCEQSKYEFCLRLAYLEDDQIESKKLKIRACDGGVKEACGHLKGQ